MKLVAGRALAAAWSLRLWFLGEGERAAPPYIQGQSSLCYLEAVDTGTERGKVADVSVDTSNTKWNLLVWGVASLWGR